MDIIKSHKSMPVKIGRVDRKKQMQMHSVALQDDGNIDQTSTFDYNDSTRKPDSPIKGAKIKTTAIVDLDSAVKLTNL